MAVMILPYCLTEKDIRAIEKAVNHPGKTEATVKVENNRLTVLLVEKKKIS